MTLIWSSGSNRPRKFWVSVYVVGINEEVTEMSCCSFGWVLSCPAMLIFFPWAARRGIHHHHRHHHHHHHQHHHHHHPNPQYHQHCTVYNMHNFSGFEKDTRNLKVSRRFVSRIILFPRGIRPPLRGLLICQPGQWNSPQLGLYICSRRVICQF